VAPSAETDNTNIWVMTVEILKIPNIRLNEWEKNATSAKIEEIPGFWVVTLPARYLICTSWTYQSKRDLVQLIALPCWFPRGLVPRL
jgi:hypothetical protein